MCELTLCIIVTFGSCLFQTLCVDIYTLCSCSLFYSQFHCSVYVIVRLKWKKTIIILVNSILAASVCSLHVSLLSGVIFLIVNECICLHVCCFGNWQNLSKIILLFYFPNFQSYWIIFLVSGTLIFGRHFQS